MFSETVEFALAATNVFLGIFLLYKGQRLSLQFSLSTRFITRESRFLYLIGGVMLMLATASLIVIGFNMLSMFR